MSDVETQGARVFRVPAASFDAYRIQWSDGRVCGPYYRTRREAERELARLTEPREGSTRVRQLPPEPGFVKDYAVEVLGADGVWRLWDECAFYSSSAEAFEAAVELSKETR